MEKISFKDFKFSLEESVNSFDFNGAQIEVLKYLPVEDKKDLVQIALQKSYEDGLYNNILLDIYFHLNIVYLYTNLEFDEDDRADEFALFDKIAGSGLMNEILAAMDQDEYQYLYDSLEKAVESHMKYKNSAAAVIQSIIQDLPSNAAAATDIVNNWDADKFQSVQDMVKLAQATGINNAIPKVVEESEPASNVVDFLQEQAKIENPQE